MKCESVLSLLVTVCFIQVESRRKDNAVSNFEIVDNRNEKGNFVKKSEKVGGDFERTGKYRLLLDIFVIGY